MKKYFNVIFGILISCAFIYLAFKNVKLGEILESLKHANYILVIPNMVMVILLMYLRAIRWRLILSPVGKYSSSFLFPSIMIGFMANNVLPARLGELVRAYSLGKKSGESRSSIFGTVVLERIFDSLALLFMFWLVILFVPFPKYIKNFGAITMALNIFLIIGLMLLKFKTELLVKISLRLFFFLPSGFAQKMEHIITKFSLGLDIVKNMKMLLYISFWSAIIWIITALSNYFVFMAFQIYPNISSCFILLLFVAAGVMLPSAPGFVGVFQAATIGAFGLLNNMGMLGLQITEYNIRSTGLMAVAYNGIPYLSSCQLIDSIGLLGISKSGALSFSIILWLSQYIPVTILGLMYLKKEHFSLKEVGS